MDGEELTEQETALYDRQIRVWGADAQRRLSKSHILVFGMKGPVAEFCKNIVLAGVGSLTLVDDRVVTEEAFSANFLIPPDEKVYGGKTIAEVCCNSLKEFNPMVHVSVEKGDFSSFDGEFYDKFDIVVISCCSFTTKKLVNEKCRKLSKRVAFYTDGSLFALVYVSQQKLEETIEFQLLYPSFENKLNAQNIKVHYILRHYLLLGQEAVSVPWKGLPRKTSKLYFAMRVIEGFEEAEGRSPGETSIEDLPAVLKLKKELCEANSLNASYIPDSLLERLIMGSKEFPPVCAIVGGILGQEVIKAISSKGEPVKNFFLFDVMDGKGVVEDVSNANKGF